MPLSQGCVQFKPIRSTVPSHSHMHWELAVTSRQARCPRIVSLGRCGVRCSITVSTAGRKEGRCRETRRPHRATGETGLTWPNSQGSRIPRPVLAVALGPLAMTGDSTDKQRASVQAAAASWKRSVCSLNKQFPGSYYVPTTPLSLGRGRGAGGRRIQRETHTTYPLP